MLSARNRRADSAGTPLFILMLTVLSGCAPEKPVSVPQQAIDAPEQTVDSVAQAVLIPEAEVATIREAIEQCGGVLQLDDAGQPVAVDLAAERGSADEAGLRAALACTGLKSLRVRAAGLSKEQLAGIGSLTSLEELFLQDVPIGDAYLRDTVATLASLRRLTLRNTSGVTSLSTIVSLPKLTHLALIDLPIASDAIEPLVRAEALVSLDLRMCGRLGGNQLAMLGGMTGLKELKLGGFGIDNQSMSAVASIATLESLTIEDASVDADGLAGLAPIAARLRSLGLARCSGLGDDALQAIEEFTSLRSLMLRDLPVTGEFLQHIAAPKQLETLALNQTFLDDEAFDAVVACKNLKRLELAQNFLGSESIRNISTLEHLEYLNLAECGLDDASIAPLKNLKNLKTLIVDGNPDVSNDSKQGNRI